MNSPSAEALARVGTSIRWERTAPTKRSAEGICIGVRRVPGVTITTDEGMFPAIEFQIEEPTGRRVWTDRFADIGVQPTAAGESES